MVAVAVPTGHLPWLAWGLAISHWKTSWSEEYKRAAVADAIPYHRRKGTRRAVEEVLARYYPSLQIVAWHQANPSKKMRAEFDRARRDSERLNAEHAKHVTRLRELRSRLSAAGVSTRDLSSEERRLRGDIERTNATLNYANRFSRLSRVALARRTSAARRYVGEVRMHEPVYSALMPSRCAQTKIEGARRSEPSSVTMT